MNLLQTQVLFLRIFVCERVRIPIIYLQIVADFNRDLGKRNGHSSVLHLADPRVHLFPGQEFLQAIQGLQVVGHDEDHGGLFLPQGHVEQEELVLYVIVEVVQT